MTERQLTVSEMNRIRICKYCKEYYKHDSEDKFKDYVCQKCRPKPKAD